MDIVHYKDWTFQVDRLATLEGYKTIDTGSAEQCECTMCENFVVSRNQVYPQEVKNLFYELGIDYKKEVETYWIVKLDNGLHNYGGWFHFVGQIIEGKEAKVDTGNNSFTYDMQEITDKFSIGFHHDSSLAFFDTSKYDLVQVEFMVLTSWNIAGDKEPF